MTGNADDGWQLSATRFIDAPPAAVWDAMKHRQAEYFCPRPWRFEALEQDWRVGGRSFGVMLGPDGERHENDGVFLEVVEGSHFVATDAFKPGWVPAGAPMMVGTWALAAEGSGTRVTASARHWNEAAMINHRDMGFDLGWGAMLDQLAELFEGGAEG